MSSHTPALAAAAALLAPCLLAAQEPRTITPERHPLRAGARAEWSETASVEHARDLALRFAAPVANGGEWTLTLRQEGVRRGWRVMLNGREAARLLDDENPATLAWALPPGMVSAGENVLRVEPLDTLPDDILVGPITLTPAPRAEVLASASIEATIEEDRVGLIPGRVTIVDESGALRETGARSGGQLAVRAGVVYTGDGRASIPLPAGRYTVYATRGFEYSVDSALVELRPGERVARAFSLQREVPTEGWVSADTHVHTLTHSGHGDATVEERAITIAGEGLELPVLTDHNVHADLEPVAQGLGVGRWFTPVRGNEFTTPVGHFNLFPVAVGAAVPSPRVSDWDGVARAVGRVQGVAAVVLNHARDVHAGFRPISDGSTLAGGPTAADGWRLPATAMEVVNSGAQMSEPLTLVHDWMSLLRAGHRLTPVGASDSHDVFRYIVGQGRTYLRTRDDDPGAIDVSEAVARFNAGAVMVSFGLLAELEVGAGHGPGERVPAGEDREVAVAVRVLGPGWVTAERVSLYLNGERVRGAEVGDGAAPGLKWSGRWTIPRPAAGGFLVAVAEGPDPRRPFWPIARPYQSTSPRTDPRVFGVSGAVWLAPATDATRATAPAN